MKSIDVLVLGGGPAGGATALILARAGLTVALVERSRYIEPRIGETLAPAARLVLDRLGLWERFRQHGHAPSYAIRSAWGKSQLYEQDFMFHPYGTGWHLDRRLFDRMITDAAEESGAIVYRGARLENNPTEECDGWSGSLRCDEEVHRFHASFIVDATGRAASLSRRRGAARKAHDALVAVVTFLSPNSQRFDREYYTLVEAMEAGWWYSALLSESRMVAIYMTDADLLLRGRQMLRGFWQASLKRTHHTRARLNEFRLESSPRVVAANSAKLDRLAGRAWLAVGDAAMAFDPLSSQGISEALESGALAGELLERYLRKDAGALREYSARMNKVFSRYIQLYEGYYGREQRWPRSAFWRRRHDASKHMEIGRNTSKGELK